MTDRLGLPGLARERKARRLTQHQLSIKSGVSVGAIQHYEARERDPRTPIVVKLAEALGVARGVLYVDDEDEEPRRDRTRHVVSAP